MSERDPNRNYDYTQARRQAKRRTVFRRMQEALEKIRDEPDISVKVRALVDEGLDDSFTDADLYLYRDAQAKLAARAESKAEARKAKAIAKKAQAAPKLTIGRIEDQGFRILLRSAENSPFYVIASHFQAGNALPGDIVAYEPAEENFGWCILVLRSKDKKEADIL